MNIDKAMKRFHRQFYGQFIRAQIVQDVEIVVDTIGGRLRYFARVYFRENPPTNESPEKNMLQVIFNEIPPYADVICYSWRELVKIISGKRPELHWRLEDEIRSQS